MVRVGNRSKVDGVAIGTLSLQHSKGDYFPYMVADGINVIVLIKFTITLEPTIFFVV
jgi:hypothetical protein